MAGSKTLLGISYILSGIPYANLLGLLLVPISWIFEGRSKKKGLWTATGILGLLTVVLLIVGLVSIIGAILSLPSAPPISPGESPSAAFPDWLSHLLKSGGLTLLTLAVFGAAFVIAIVYFFMMVASLFQAGGFYRSGLIRIAAILYILVVVAIIAGTAILMMAIQEYINSGGEPREVLGAAVSMTYVVVLVTLVLNFLAGVLAGIGFLTAKEPEAEKPESLPPPPPPEAPAPAQVLKL